MLASPCHLSSFSDLGWTVLAVCVGSWSSLTSRRVDSYGCLCPLFGLTSSLNLNSPCPGTVSLSVAVDLLDASSVFLLQSPRTLGRNSGLKTAADLSRPLRCTSTDPSASPNVFTRWTLEREPRQSVHLSLKSHEPLSRGRVSLTLTVAGGCPSRHIGSASRHKPGQRSGTLAAFRNSEAESRLKHVVIIFERLALLTGCPCVVSPRAHRGLPILMTTLRGQQGCHVTGNAYGTRCRKTGGFQNSFRKKFLYSAQSETVLQCVYRLNIYK